MSDWKPRVFWTEARAVPATGGYTVELDGRPVRTPAKAPLVVPSEPLAQALAGEWAVQTEVVDPTIMPLTRTANSAIDKVTHQHADVAEMLAAYGDADLLCYRADSPAELVDRQNREWDPVLDWAASELGARLAPRQGILHAPQDPVALETLRSRVHALDPFELAAFHDLVAISGSLVLGFASFLTNWTGDRLWEISRLDETWQEEQWGVDDEAREVAALKKAAFDDARRFMSLLAQDSGRS
ncbi:Chaperone required for the assembly of the F1-ATPase [Pseudooceanicola antarcticus]|uniref:ATPase n=1 Tax=Pseudooceanicola antarcticus TaxID=1247613 RepID=A0A285ITP5_9RHOB|nr:ATP12 family protein [Pseudooceanicola antarcticus]PJE31737.1 ATPase [Pseudooceanicola antarcticus]SNY50311.1 Chaperone required for the assembly of the F1-ATPase [Pseudooceanicola antarcticus]